MIITKNLEYFDFSFVQEPSESNNQQIDFF